MLHTIDRVQIATPDAEKSAENWEKLLDAEKADVTVITCLNATAHSYRIGRGYVEFLTPNGPGPVQDALEKRGGPHLFAGGASADDVAAVAAHLKSQDIPFDNEAGQLHVNLDGDIDGLRMVISAYEDRPRVGRIDFLYEVTLLHKDAQAATDRFCKIFGLDGSHFSPITSEEFGYYGILTLFDPDDLHRFEVITPTAPEKTMARFFDRTGPCLYMAFGESDVMSTIEADTNAAGAGQTIDRPENRDASRTPDQMWLHPPTLGGMMLGISRPTMAWTWSGKPDRVVGID